MVNCSARYFRMSRIGNSPINIPDGINIKVDNKKIEVSGSKGSH